MEEGGARPAITIGVPIYNDALHISEALDCLLAQSFTDFEIIISDNASVDGSGYICEQYSKRDCRIRYVRQPHNLGARDNFLFVLHNADSEFFMWAASDDKWHPDFLRKCVGALRMDLGCVVAFCPFITIDANGQLIGGPYEFNFSAPTSLLRLLRFNCNFSGLRDGFWYGLYRRDLIKDLRIRSWWWLNVNSNMDIAYPILTFFLIRGNYALVATQALFQKRLHLRSEVSDSCDSNKRILLTISLLLRQVNVAYFCLLEVIHGRRNFFLIVGAFSIIALRCCADVILVCARTGYLAVRKALMMIKQLAPLGI